MRPAHLIAGDRPAVVLVAHGSRDPRAAAATEALSRAVRRAHPGWQVHATYLDHAGPRPLDVLASLPAGTRAVVVPLLLTAAYHGRVDVPAVLEAAAGLPIRVTLADVLGPLPAGSAPGRDVPPLLLEALLRRVSVGRSPSDCLVPGGCSPGDCSVPSNCSPGDCLVPAGPSRGDRLLPAGLPQGDRLPPAGLPEGDRLPPAGPSRGDRLLPAGLPRGDRLLPAGLPRGDRLPPAGLPQGDRLLPAGCSPGGCLASAGLPRGDCLLPAGCPTGDRPVVAGEPADGELDAIVLAAAGTRDAAARETVEEVARALGVRLGLPWAVAYASAAPPTAGEAVARLRTGGARRVGMAAYFLAPGKLYDIAVRSALEAGAVAVAEPMTDAPELVRLIAARVGAVAVSPLNVA